MLTVENVNKHFPESDETVKGHMNHQRQGVGPTKPKDFQEPNASREIGKKEGCIHKSCGPMESKKTSIQTKLELFPSLPRVGQDMYNGDGDNRCPCNLVVSNQKQDRPRVNSGLQNLIGKDESN